MASRGLTELRRELAFLPGSATAIPVAAGTAAVLLTAAAAVRPVEVLLGIGLVLITLVGAWRADLALLLLIGLAPLEGAFGGDGLSPVKLAGLLAFSSFALNAVATRRRIQFDWLHAIVIGLLLLAALSTLFAFDVFEARSVTFRYASFVGLFFIVSQFVGDRSLQTRVAWVLSAASALAGVLAVNGFLTGGRPLASLPYGDPNDTAFVLATTLPLTFWLLRGRSGLARVLVVAMIVVIALSVVLSFSRGAILGLIAGAVLQAFLNRRQLPLIILGFVVIAIATTVVFQTNTATVERGFNMKRSIAATNVESRFETWGAALRLSSENPIGVGPGNFRYHFAEAAGRPPGSSDVRVVHNAYLDIGAELGLLGLGLFLGYLALALRFLNAAVRERIGAPGFAEAVRASLVVASVAAITLSEQYYAPFWVLGGLAAALWAERRRSEQPLQA